MPLNYPTFLEIIERNRASIALLLPQLDPSITGSYVQAFTDSQASRSHDVLLLLKQLETKAFFPFSATGEFLEAWAAYERLTRLAASASAGNVTFTGAWGSLLPVGATARSSPGDLYTVVGTPPPFAAVNAPISSLTRAGAIATAVTAAPHSIATGMSVEITGADQSEYNGVVLVTVLSPTSFTYAVSGTPVTPATGLINAGFIGLSIAVTSNESGLGKNLSSGATLTLAVPVAGVDATATTQFDGVTGGVDVESDDDLRARIFLVRRNVVTEFNPTAIERTAKTIAGVTRVKVNRITPAIGEVTVLFVRDNDPSIIPTAAQVAEVEAAILETLPADKAPADLHVEAPIPVSTDYVFSAYFPATVTMRTAITKSIQNLYLTGVDFETDIVEEKYRAAIIDTVDTETGEKLASFTLSSPSGDITVTTGELGVLGVVSF
jgi:uncharacterized phage protein gp47/JayE